MRNWLNPSPIQVPAEISNAVGGHPLIAETLVRRGITTPQAAMAFLDPARYSPSPASDLPGISAASDRLAQAVHQKEMICVWGDFDVDGQTATTVLVSALRDLGAQVFHYIPVRAKESHGVHLASLQRILDTGAKLILTCDTGISAHEAVNYANARGATFIVTDHHELPDHLPSAFATINPRLLPAEHALSTLPGVGVAWKLVEHLFAQMQPSRSAEPLLDLVALGIVADVAMLTGDTRYLLQRGLTVLRQAERLGLRILMEVAELNPKNITTEHIGFVLGPRLNALGRLGDANSIVELLTTQDSSRARILALELEGLNARRQLLTNQVYQAALMQIEREPQLLESSVLILSHPNWPAGVLGIVANRLVEIYQRPVILISTPDGELGRGSARSVPGTNITQAIAAVDAQSHLLSSYGGHAMAAGLAIQPDRIAEFRTTLSQVVADIQSKQPFTKELLIDAYIPFSGLNVELVADIERLAPFGAGNPPIILATRQVKRIKHSVIGRNQEHLLLTISDEAETSQEVIWWQGASQQLPDGKFDLAYSIQMSDYRGQPSLQVQWVEARASEITTIELETKPRVISITDYRHTPFPQAILAQLSDEESVMVWCEDTLKNQVNGKNRLELAPARTLIIWNIPPGRNEFQAALAKVQPETVILLSVDPNVDRPEALLPLLAGMVKFALNHRSGQASLAQMAAASAQRPAAVLAGLDWLSATGKMSYTRLDEDGISFSLEAQPAPLNASEIDARLRSILQEVAAYRAYYLRAQAETML